MGRLGGGGGGSGGESGVLGVGVVGQGTSVSSVRWLVGGWWLCGWVEGGGGRGGRG